MSKADSCIIIRNQRGYIIQLKMSIRSNASQFNLNTETSLDSFTQRYNTKLWKTINNIFDKFIVWQ